MNHIVAPMPAPPQSLLDDIAAAAAGHAARRVHHVDLDALCREIEAEADEIEARQRRTATSRA